ncbi:hypothetical protein COW80_00680 [Candidatus Beckwithbacteria bacterium CG22_combo_CG10-13_8_21_14_all_01_47_9]|uniref:BrnT family toxin n=2 Tax=Candidatus Beckwithiibacteriota TaxID=1752726 RepID=A0A2H0E1Q8_9BACT|nr:MAG: hypothetical protein COW80_00680 [Candidatus Beckwithbacteria bacterium CG22_combo_CG10-13_8_21_14_all_01_47_9]PJC66065.1 MAG: hypothetical protein CO018_03895 [Candidatus Beckwithbacteria bacterium CG_4_9_14_0_2_um_filter_47_11]
MVSLPKLIIFDWNKGNLDKSYLKHGITQRQAEEAYLDEKLILIEDIKHSQKEKRHIVIGKDNERKILFTVFTKRGRKIRIISARVANKKERRTYEKI